MVQRLKSEQIHRQTNLTEIITYPHKNYTHSHSCDTRIEVLFKTNYFPFRRGNKKKRETPRNGAAAATAVAAAGAQEDSVYEELDELQIMNCNCFSL